MSSEDNSTIDGLEPWVAARELSSVSAVDAKWSRGFLKIEFNKWFNSLHTHWGLLFETLHAEWKMIDIKTSVSNFKINKNAFYGSIDSEPCIFQINDDSGLLEALVLKANPVSRNIFEEYLARKFFRSLSLSWGGTDDAVILYEPSGKTAFPGFTPHGAITGDLEINEKKLSFTVFIARGALERIDTMWRKHLAKNVSNTKYVGSLEVAQLAVPPAMLAEYTKPDTVIDLEVQVTDQVICRIQGHDPKLFRIKLTPDGLVAIELMPGDVQDPVLPDGTTRLSIELGIVELSDAIVNELSEPGSLFLTTVNLNSGTVKMIVDGQVMAGAKLQTYEGRFAVTVI